MEQAKILKKVFAWALAVVITAGFALPASAEVTLDELLKRVEAVEQKNTDLEKENASLKAEVMAMKEKQAAPVQVAAASATPAATVGNFLKTKADVELYGFIKADMVVSNHDMGNTGTSITQTNATRPTASTGGDDPEAQMSGQDTRLGLKFKAPDLDAGGKVSGQFEMDFANSSTSLNGNYTPRLRLAFVQLEYDFIPEQYRRGCEPVNAVGSPEVRRPQLFAV